MTLEIWKRPAKNFWPLMPEISISAPSAIMVLMAISSLASYTTNRYVWKARA